MWLVIVPNPLALDAHRAARCFETVAERAARLAHEPTTQTRLVRAAVVAHLPEQRAIELAAVLVLQDGAQFVDSRVLLDEVVRRVSDEAALVVDGTDALGTVAAVLFHHLASAFGNCTLLGVINQTAVGPLVPGLSATAFLARAILSA